MPKIAVSALTTQRTSVEVRVAYVEDYVQIKALAARHGLDEKEFDEWKHLWLGNPVYRQIAKSWPLGWVLEDSNRNIVGYLGNIPLSYEFEGKGLLAATSRAWVVDSQYRSYSLLLLDYFFAQPVDLYLTTSLNAEAFKGFQFFEPLRVPIGEWGYSRFWITNPVGFLVSLFATKGIRFAKYLTYLCSLPLLGGEQFTRLRLRRKASGEAVQSCSCFDERFDVFWEDLKRNRPRTLLGNRSREILEWHFGPGLSGGKVWIFCITDRQRLIAYSIFYRQDNEFGLKRVRLADFQTLTEKSSVLIPMLYSALERCRMTGIHMLEIAGLHPRTAAAVEGLAPHQRELPCWPAFYKTSNSKLAEKFNDPNVWDLSWFDGDSSL